MKQPNENQKALVIKLYNSGTKASDIIAQTGVPREALYIIGSRAEFLRRHRL